MTNAAANRLTLRSFANRSPAVKDALTRPGQPALFRRREFFPPWILGASTRYCPSCLAGNGTEIQRRHGGPWKIEWRLATVFACLDHGMFLRELCPACQQPAHSGHRGNKQKLVPASSTTGLHPAQCRNTASGLPRDPLCTTRLDSPHETHHPALTPNIAKLQGWILGLLDAAHPPAPALTALTDLQTISAVVCATWPAAATVTPETNLVHALDEHITHQGQTPTARLTPTAKSHRWATPPQSSAATASLLDIAARLIALPPWKRDITPSPRCWNEHRSRPRPAGARPGPRTAHPAQQPSRPTSNTASRDACHRTGPRVAGGTPPSVQSTPAATFPSTFRSGSRTTGSRS
ncbi:TniQ family protein [Streptomyces sp. Je 1-369]|uniref:TniQ family protein n=1 Tax=Streptomyces sp. Je 1-369 TaxID=2966192 RepID=UPI0039E0C9AD